MNAWKKILICGRIGDVEVTMDSTGRWFLTTRVTVTENDNCGKFSNFSFKYTRHSAVSRTVIAHLGILISKNVSPFSPLRQFFSPSPERISNLQ